MADGGGSGLAAWAAAAFLGTAVLAYWIAEVPTLAFLCLLACILLAIVAGLQHSRRPPKADPPRPPELHLGDAFHPPGLFDITGQLTNRGAMVGAVPVVWKTLRAWQWRIPVANSGSATDVRVLITKIEPSIPGLPTGTARPLHMVGDGPAGDSYRESRQLDQDEQEWYDLVSAARSTTLDEKYPMAGEGDPPQVFLHNVRGTGKGVEPFRFEGTFKLTVTAYGGRTPVFRVYTVKVDRFSITVDGVGQ